MKTSIFLFLALLTTTIAEAQVSKNVIVEHFTNTRCSICASRNPGFYSNLENHPNVIHVAYHPSAPYNTCVLNLHNVSGNDGRTNHYNIYGSTPRIVIQGDVISASTNYGSMTLFTPYENQTAAISIVFTTSAIQGDSVFINLEATVEDTHSYQSLDLYVGLYEDTVFYNAPNGEDEHYDVFRIALTGASGELVSVPSTVGQKISFSAKVKISPEWDLSRMYPVAILQETTSKDVIQVEKGSYAEQVTSVGEPEVSSLSFDNLVRNTLVIDHKLNALSIYDLNGRLVKQSNYWTGEMDVSDLDSGLYILVYKLGQISNSYKLVVVD
ncbi:MAG: T9SS type A sorting domain-containing protein [Chitinophagales bacterium]|nr:T9SS type A sorting domain-containing protein [Chitinophagales bacterium]